MAGSSSSPVSLPLQQRAQCALHAGANSAFALTAELVAPAEGASVSRIQLTPLGKFRAYDGRPSLKEMGFEDWEMNQASLDAILAGQSQGNRANDIVVDIGHATLNAGFQQAPAAGWIKRSALSLMDDQTGEPPNLSGLWAEVEWTPVGLAAIRNKEYKYISPVLMADKQGRVIGLHSVALTNDPALSNMAAVALSAQFTTNQPIHQPKEKSMLLVALQAALGLQSDASEATALTAVSALAAENARLRDAAFDPAKHIPLEQYTSLQAQHAALSGQVESDAKSAALAAGLSDGRILPAQKDYWEAQPLEALNAYLKVAQPIAALISQQSAGKPEEQGKPQALSAEDIKVCAITGMSQEAFAARKAQMLADAQRAQAAAA